MPPTKEELRRKLLALAAGPEEDLWDVVTRGLPLLAASNASGFYFVFPTASNKWQPKPTVRGKQRGLGTFDDVHDAARVVLQWALGLVEDPPSPEKERAHRGAGKRPRDKRHGMPCAPFPLFLPLTEDACLLAGGPGRYKPKAARAVEERARVPAAVGPPVEPPALPPLGPRVRVPVQRVSQRRVEAPAAWEAEAEVEAPVAREADVEAPLKAVVVAAHDAAGQPVM